MNLKTDFVIAPAVIATIVGTGLIAYYLNYDTNSMQVVEADPRLARYVSPSCKEEDFYFRDTPKVTTKDMLPGDSGWTWLHFSSDTDPVFACPGANVRARLSKTATAYRVQYTDNDMMLTTDTAGVLRFSIK